MLSRICFSLVFLICVVACDEPGDVTPPVVNTPNPPNPPPSGGTNLGSLPQNDVLAFPGAEGYGRFAGGWQGGEVLVVTNLNDAGPGSLRAAINYSGPSVIVFDVSGTIELQSSLDESHGNVYVAGQTSKHGITLTNYELNISASNSIVRHIKSRAGESTGDNVHAFQIWARRADVNNVILDHITATGGTDECIAVIANPTRPGMFRVRNVTISNSIIGPGFGGHGFGMLIKYNVDDLSVFRNFFYGNIQRNPQWNGGTGELINNVIANWRGQGATFKEDQGTGTKLELDVIGNYAWAGSGSKNSQGYHMPENTDQKMYLEQNYHSVYRTDPNNTDETAIFDDKLLTEFGHNNLAFSVSDRFVDQETSIMDVFEARDWVKDFAGSMFRDELDEQIISNFEDGISVYYSSQQQFGAIPIVPNESRGIDWKSLSQTELEEQLEELAGQ